MGRAGSLPEITKRHVDRQAMIWSKMMNLQKFNSLDYFRSLLRRVEEEKKA